MEAKIVLTPGDGIGPEVVDAARRVLEAVGETYGHTFEFGEFLIGGSAIDRYGTPLPQETLEACLAWDAVLLGAVGAPKWDNPAALIRPEQGILGLRKAMGVFANLRPVKTSAALVNSSPLRAEKLEGVDLLVVRELTGGLYFGQPRGRDESGGHVRAFDTLVYHDYEIERIIDLAFQLAMTRKMKVTSVDKANVLESSRLWREISIRVGNKYPEVTLEHMLVDSAAMQLVTNPSSFDVLVTENMFGDILTDEAAVLSGSLGMLPSASLSLDGPGLYEPIHGSAPDIAGLGIANPIGTVLSAALLLRLSLKLETEAGAIEKAVNRVIADGQVTPDVGGNQTTHQVTDRIIENILDKT
jgi:3-isopropylmalate dehydrogenase